MSFNPHPDWSDQNLGRFRVSVSSDPAAFDREQKRFAAMNLTDSWARLAFAYAANRRNDEASRHCARALEQAEGYIARRQLVELGSRFDGLVAGLIKRKPDDPQLQLALARELARRGKQDLAHERPAQAQAELEKASAILRRLLSESGNWTVVTPVEMKSEIGVKLEVQKDGSVFAHHEQSDSDDTYTLVFQTELKGITGLRLEALADPRLPRGGPGWKANYGNFVLTELALLAPSAGSPDEPRSIRLRGASADFSEPGLDVNNAIDGNTSTGWAIGPEINKDHTALFELAEPVGELDGSRLTIRLDNQWPEPGFNLGHFRVSFTTAFEAAHLRQELKDGEVADLNAALAEACAGRSRLPAQAVPR